MTAAIDTAGALFGWSPTAPSITPPQQLEHLCELRHVEVNTTSRQPCPYGWGRSTFDEAVVGRQISTYPLVNEYVSTDQPAGDDSSDRSMEVPAANTLEYR
jgi:hypothetical protein